MTRKELEESMFYQPSSSLLNPYTKNALQQMGIEQPSWQTLIASASKEVNLPRQVLWEAWTKLEDWPIWSKSLHVATHWVSEAGWRVGAKFEQDLNLGFPLGTTTSAETVGAIVPGESVQWWKDEKGIKSHHFWLFEDLSIGKTRITNTEIFHGTPMGLVKPLVAKNWQRMFEASVDGLIQHTQKQK